MKRHAFGRVLMLSGTFLALHLFIQPLCFALDAGDMTRLTRIDFDASAGTTELTVFADNLVPFRKTLVSDDKLIIDFDHVASSQQIETHFNDAENVSHVVVQPLSENQIRLIIRGEHLAPPSINFHENPRAAAAPRIASSPFQNDQPLGSGSSGKSSSAPVVHQAPKPLHDGALDSPIGNPLRADIPTHNAKSHDGGLADITAFSGKFDLIAILQYGLLGGLLIFLCLFIRHKILEITRQQTHHEDDEYIQEQEQQAELAAPTGKRSGFSAIANAYRQNKGHVEPSKNNKPGKKQSKQQDSLIGLRGLSQPADSIQDEIIEDIPARAPEIIPEQPAAPQPVLQQPAPSRQVVNQYLKQQHPTLGKPATPKQPAQPTAPTRQRKVTDDVLRQELNRNNELNRFPELNRPAPKQAAQQLPPQPVRRPVTQPAARPAQQSPSATSRQQQALANRGPLPGNPEVLNFLRDVADLMEKDGQHHLAQSINKNLR